MGRRVESPKAAEAAAVRKQASEWRERWQRRLAALVPDKSKHEQIIEGLERARERRGP